MHLAFSQKDEKIPATTALLRESPCLLTDWHSAAGLLTPTLMEM